MTSILKRLNWVMAISFAVALSSCNDSGEKKAEETKAEEIKTEEATPVTTATFTPFKVIMVQYPVADFDKWKAAYMTGDSVRKANDITRYLIGQGLDDPKKVIVINKIADVQKAKNFSKLPYLKEAMKKSGVTGQPVFSYADVIRNNDTQIAQKERVMIAHKVKDFDAWLKVYDSEGEAKRTENGLLDRGLGRSIDDPNMVYIVFAITDMAKAKARINSPELKTLMTEAGVEGPRKIIYYKLVD